MPGKGGRYSVRAERRAERGLANERDRWARHGGDTRHAVRCAWQVALRARAASVGTGGSAPAEKTSRTCRELTCGGGRAGLCGCRAGAERMSGGAASGGDRGMAAAAEGYAASCLCATARCGAGVQQRPCAARAGVRRSWGSRDGRDLADLASCELMLQMARRCSSASGPFEVVFEPRRDQPANWPRSDRAVARVAAELLRRQRQSGQLPGRSACSRLPSRALTTPQLCPQRVGAIGAVVLEREPSRNRFSSRSRASRDQGPVRVLAHRATRRPAGPSLLRGRAWCIPLGRSPRCRDRLISSAKLVVGLGSRNFTVNVLSRASPRSW